MFAWKPFICLSIEQSFHWRRQAFLKYSLLKQEQGENGTSRSRLCIFSVSTYILCVCPVGDEFIVILVLQRKHRQMEAIYSTLYSCVVALGSTSWKCVSFAYTSPRLIFLLVEYHLWSAFGICLCSRGICLYSGGKDSLHRIFKACGIVACRWVSERRTASGSFCPSLLCFCSFCVTGTAFPFSLCVITISLVIYRKASPCLGLCFHS